MSRLKSGEIGSPIAQMLFTGCGWHSKTDDYRRLSDHYPRYFDIPWESIIDEVRDALRDWYL